MLGRKVLKVRPPVPINKGHAVRELVGMAGANRALYGGDDTTDLDAVDALDALVAERKLDMAVRVGVRSDEGTPELVQRADVVVDDVGGFARVLDSLLHGEVFGSIDIAAARCDAPRSSSIGHSARRNEV